MRFGPSHSIRKPTVYRDHRISRPQNPLKSRGDIMTFNVTNEPMTFNNDLSAMDYN